jgi:hypothetical protein
VKLSSISTQFLINSGFKLIQDTTIFECLTMPYYTRNGVILFFNESDWTNFLVGYGEMRCGKYHVVTFRWIKTEEEVRNFYTLLTNKNF